jgi:hypothetical protein
MSFLTTKVSSVKHRSGALIERRDATAQDAFAMRWFIGKEANDEVRRIHAGLDCDGC